MRMLMKTIVGVVAVAVALGPTLLLPPAADACHADVSISVECRDSDGVSTVTWYSTPDHTHSTKQVDVYARPSSSDWAAAVLVGSFLPVDGVEVSGSFEWPHESVQVRTVATHHGGTRTTAMIELVYCPPPSTTTSTTTSTTQPPETTTTTSTTQPPVTTTSTTSTAPPASSTTTVPTTTSSTPPPSTTSPPTTMATTTTIAPPSSTVPPTITTVVIDTTTSTTTDSPTTTTTTTLVSVTTTTRPPELPHTGLEFWVFSVAGLVMLAAGGLAIWRTRDSGTIG